ncbi:uncharacterized protein PRCAT00002729001 [Priceomyces carsonii]|uniref:uncharacterized protein n=1 Tax=Priceomyces carsonii TaxID=28549 RepID=UPI002EDB54FB|nr:unnamed protein product [Priceomyces carsonii]
MFLSWNIDTIVYGAIKYRVELLSLLILKKELALSFCIIVLVLNFLYYVNKKSKLPDTNKWTPINEKDVALVTGGSRGLGKDIVNTLIEMNIGKVIIIDLIDPETRGDKIEYYNCDVGDYKDLNSKLDHIIQRERISILVNNAAQRHSESLLHLLDDKVKDLFNVNTFAQIWILRKILKNHIYNVLQDVPNAKLSVVSVSSILGILAPKNLSIYSASKAALIQIHEALVEEMKEFSTVRFLSVVTGQLNTEMFQDVDPSRKFFAPILDSSDLAKMICDKVSSGEIGTLSAPLYAKFLPVIKVFPFLLQSLCRRFSKMDEKIIDRTNSFEALTEYEIVY